MRCVNLVEFLCRGPHGARGPHQGTPTTMHARPVISANRVTPARLGKGATFDHFGLAINLVLHCQRFFFRNKEWGEEWNPLTRMGTNGFISYCHIQGVPSEIKKYYPVEFVNPWG